MINFRNGFLFLLILISLSECKPKEIVIGDRLPDSLFAYSQINSTVGFEDTLKHGKKLSRTHYVRLIKPFLEKTFHEQVDTNRIMLDDYYYISKISLNPSYRSIIVESIGEDMQGLILFSINKKGDYLDCYNLAGVFGCSGAWEVDSSYYETCINRNSRFNDNSIMTSIKKHYFKPINDSINYARLDSLSYRIILNNEGKFISTQLDSVRLFRYEK
jgi:hypothetical protein